jgi:Fic family protein
MSLTPRQQLIFDEFLLTPTQPRSVADFADFGLERTTLFRDLKAIVQTGLLQREGKAYRVCSNSDAYVRWDLSRAPHERASVRYQAHLLSDYRPNSTFLLSDTQLKTLEHAGKVVGVAQAAEKTTQYKRILTSLLIDLTHASSNLENVAISWLDTKSLIEFGERPDGLSERQLRIVLNHKEAISYVIEQGAALSLSKRDVLDIHTLLIKGLLSNTAGEGALRSMVVKFDDSQYLPPDNPHQLKEIFAEFCEKATAISHPYEQAFFVLLFIAYIQPFEDGNTRTSRIAMNIPLIKHALAPFSFSDMKRRDYLFGLLAFYERGMPHFLADAFTAAYPKSAARYGELILHINEGGLLNTISSQ